MITVIATGFDGTRKREPAKTQTAQGVGDQASIRAPRERDFLEELERQRQELGNGSVEVGRENGAAAAVLTPARVERTVGEVAPAKKPVAYDADDLEIPSFLRRK